MIPPKVIGFDADDTLWVNLPYFLEVEKAFADLMKQIDPMKDFSRELYKTELQNMPLYGYGAKAFTLSLIETATRHCGNNLPADLLECILTMGKSLLQHPVVLLDDVEKVLRTLQGRFRCILVTKGDLLDQERKLKKSGLQSFFHHIEILSDKRIEDYQRMIKRLDIAPESFLMVGDSIKSDILPALAMGSHAVHIPFHTSWQFEIPDDIPDENAFVRLERMGQLPELLGIHSLL